MSQRFRSLLMLLVGGVVFVFVADWLANRPDVFDLRDFLEYWSAGRVNLRGGNPYDPSELLAEQQLAAPERKDAVMMWNPPPALAIYMPVGALSPKLAASLWVGMQLAAMLVACDLLWRTYCDSLRWFSIVIGATFVGTWWLFEYGQNTGFLLLGLAGFLHFQRKDKPLTAGAFAALTALKPHLLACFGVLLIADAVTKRGAKSLASGIAAVALALGAALAANPHVISQFIEGTRHPAEGVVPLSRWELPVPAYWLRNFVAEEHFWVQFVPCLAACAGILAYRTWKRNRWDWSRELPFVVAVSLMTSPYGGWIFDLPVLLVPAIWAGARLVAARKWTLAVAFVVGQMVITRASFEWAKILSRHVTLADYWWVAPASLALCLLAFLASTERKPAE